MTEENKKKYISMEVFDFEFFDKDDNLLFEVDTVKSNIFKVNENDDYIYLEINDVLFDANLFNLVMSGHLQDSSLRVVGSSILRNKDMLSIHSKVEIKEAYIAKYEKGFYTGDSKDSILILRIPYAVYDGNIARQNVNMKIGE